MRMSLSRPKPVVTPYTVWSEATIRSTIAWARCSLARAGSPRVTRAPPLATTAICSRARCSPSSTMVEGIPAWPRAPSRAENGGTARSLAQRPGAHNSVSGRAIATARTYLIDRGPRGRAGLSAPRGLQEGRRGRALPALQDRDPPARGGRAVPRRQVPLQQLPGDRTDRSRAGRGQVFVERRFVREDRAPQEDPGSGRHRHGAEDRSPTPG